MKLHPGEAVVFLFSTSYNVKCWNMLSMTDFYSTINIFPTIHQVIMRKSCVPKHSQVSCLKVTQNFTQVAISAYFSCVLNQFPHSYFPRTIPYSTISITGVYQYSSRAAERTTEAEWQSDITAGGLCEDFLRLRKNCNNQLSTHPTLKKLMKIS